MSKLLWKKEENPMIKRKTLGKKILSILLCMALAVSGMMVPAVNVQAADGTTTAKTIAGLGTGIIAEPTVPTADTDEWAGSYVYYGTYGGNPVKYRVLDKDSTDFGGTTMLLDCDTVLWAGSDPSSAFDADGNVWADSDIKSYLNSTFLTTSFSTLEQNAIAGSTKTSAGSTDGNGWSALGWTSLNGEKIFFLDAKEATNTSYGYYNTDYVATGRIKTGGNACWWLRSPNTNYSNFAGYVYEDGYISYCYVDSYNVGVSPAFNINPSSVLFSSVISGTAGETGAEYKLTLLDSDMTIAGNGDVTRSGDKVTIPYTISGTNAGNATQVSILILDRAYSEATKNEAVVKYYGALDTSAGNGTGTFTLPAELSDKVCGKDYYAYIIAEDVNGEKETDYASAPVKIQIPWTTQAMNLGVNGIIDPIVPTSTSDAWTGSYVYYGTYSGNPVKYRVLDKDSTDFGGTTMLLDCDTVLWAGSDPSSAFDADSNVWADSDIKSYLNSTFLTTSFSSLEQKAIAGSTKTSTGSTDGNGRSDFGWTSLNGEKIFFLDAKEATNTSYGYYDTDYDAKGRIKTGGNACWWLRSPGTSLRYDAGYVYEDGDISIYSVGGDDVGVSPALNLNLSSVIFSSARGTSKSDALTSSSNEIGSTTGTEWKLTLSDSGKSVKVTDNEKVIKSADGTITVPYTYTDTATVEAEKVNQISVMITDKAYTESDANILYYGALQNIKDANGNASTVANAATGTGTFELPSGLDGKVIGTDYHVYILAEHTTDTNATDYASMPVEIAICEPIDSVAMEITAPVGGAALDTDASVTAEGVSASTVSTTWTEAGSQVSGNADYNTVYTVSFALIADDAYGFTTATTATINGDTATVVRNNAESITVTYTFPATAKEDTVKVSYATHVQKDGWQEEVSDGTMSGTSGQAKRLEGITIAVDTEADLGIQYTTHCQTYGWLPWVSNGDMSGTTGEAKRLEAIMIQLTGEDAENYDIYYRVHAQTYGWLGWAKNGEPAGTAGYGKRLEGIQVIVVKKGETIDKNLGGIKSTNSSAYIASAGKSPVYDGTTTDNQKPVVAGDKAPTVSYRTHVQTYGWLNYEYNGGMSGTTGKSKRLEGIQIDITNTDLSGDVIYTTHAQTYGWQSDLNDKSTWYKNGAVAGTHGQAKRLEGICIDLTGELKESYDIYYRVHIQTYGWLDWACNGEMSGSEGLSKRLEGIQIVIVQKGSDAPASNYGGITSVSDKEFIK
ncbi:MAG: hypothetical protein IJO70_02515 [Lachnospiraceae bacterium]|nr:hypothetical protein [Lachnospiraceae bacterium]